MARVVLRFIRMIQAIFLLFFLAIFGACSSDKTVVHGYSGQELESAVQRIRGLSAEETINKLGTPAVHGKCKSCGPKVLYRIIYLNRDMRKFYYDLSLNTDMEVDCVILDFLPNPKIKKYTFAKYSTSKNCNRRDGEINRFQQFLDAPQ